jgi:tRNA-modifying protein YgfZ
MSEHAVRLPPGRIAHLRRSATIVVTTPGVVHVDGSGALQCLQGLLTNDLDKPGDGSLVYGAFLTPKGMIVTDAWCMRRGTRFTLVVPIAGRDALLDIFRRTLPPRLAKPADVTSDSVVAWLIGRAGSELAAAAGLAPLPDAPARVTEIDTPAGAVLFAAGAETSFFSAMLVGPRLAVESAVGRLESAGARPGDAADLEAARVLAGWPALGLEIDERTLPQEVRYDELGGVSYTKGCYTGQETVARLHFRGHTNRDLRGLVWHDAAPVTDPGVVKDGKPVGTVRSILASGDRTVALALLRREVGLGDVVTAAGRAATVVPLPFADTLIAG